MPAPRFAHIITEWKTLARLGGPILVAQMSQMANGAIDTIMAGRYSAQDLAGVAIANSFWLPLFLFFLGTLNALQPVIARHHGSGHVARVWPTFQQGVWIALLSSVLMITALLHVAPLLAWLRVDAVTAGITHGYLAGFVWGIPAMLLLGALRGLTDGLGHTRIMMVASLLSNVVNLPLNYLFIYGAAEGTPWAMEAMGGAGCGWATSWANWVACLAVCLYLYWRPLTGSVPNASASSWRVNKELFSLLKLGLPIGGTLFFEVGMFTVIALLLAPLGPVVVAGHQLVLNVVSLVFMVPLSLGMALTLRVSYLIGAGTPQHAQVLARSALLLALGIAAINIPLLVFGRHAIAALYTHDPAVQTIATQLLRLAALFQLADVLQVTAISALRGYHDTRVAMLIILLSFWGIGIPIGYTLTYTDIWTPAMGAAGFWTGLIAALACACVLLLWRLLRFQLKAAH